MDDDLRAFFAALGGLTDMDLIALSADPPDDPRPAIRARVEPLVRRQSPERLDDALSELRGWISDVGSYVPAGIYGSTLNERAVELRMQAMPAIRDALLVTIAGEAIDPADADALAGPWRQVTSGD